MRTRLFCTVAFRALARAQDPNAIDLQAPEIALWPNGAPGSAGVTAQSDLRAHPGAARSAAGTVTGAAPA